MRMIDMDEIVYTQAFAYKKTKLWKKLWDSQIFAVRFADGETGYCSVMGRNGEHIALGVYVGESGFYSYCSAIEQPSGIDDFHRMEYMFSQDCLMCSFVYKSELSPDEIAALNAYCAKNAVTLRGSHACPQIQRIRPLHIPWPVREDADKQYLSQALEAAVEVARRLETSAPEQLCLEEGSPFEHPIPLLVKTPEGYDWQRISAPPKKAAEYPGAGRLSDIHLRRATLAKKQGDTWACDVFLLPNPISGEEGETGEPYNAPYLPWVQMVYSMDEDVVLDTTACKEKDSYTDVFPNKLLELMGRLGRPRRLLTITRRSEALYQDVAEETGVKLELAERCEPLATALAEFITHLMSREEVGEDGIPDSVRGRLAEILMTCSDFSGCPDELLPVFAEMAQAMGETLPDSQRLLLEQEILRRKK